MENSNTKHFTGSPLQEDELFRGAGISWTKSKEEAWKAISLRIATAPGQPAVIRRMSVAMISLAAGFLILVSGTLFLSFYTRTIQTVPGENRMHQFSDGSLVRLNGESSLSWQPGRWLFARKVKLSGEGYFEVSRGKRFEVASRNGVTTVLGTRFTIIAREQTYEVSCIAGKVRVESIATRDALILQPDERATLNNHGKLELDRLTDIGKKIPWIQETWTFTGEPLATVIQIIEKAYRISIILPDGDQHLFTGNIARTMPVVEVLDLVCTPFGYTFTKKAEGVFEILAE